MSDFHIVDHSSHIRDQIDQMMTPDHEPSRACDDSLGLRLDFHRTRWWKRSDWIRRILAK